MKKINFILILKLSKIYYFGNEMYYHAGVLFKINLDFYRVYKMLINLKNLSFEI